ncbi:MAG: AMIN domain-containing protein, partial [Pseudomonadota bacterium]|nr:AMIN domain-containing protein [Pseudomonadota bacterium]
MNGINLQKAFLGTVLGTVAAGLSLAKASEIKGLRIDSGATGTRAELKLDREGQYTLIQLRNPDRLVVDFPESTLRRGLVLPRSTGIVKGIRTGQPQPGTVRIVFDLASNVSPLKPRVEQSADGPRLVLEWPGDGAPQEAQLAKTQPESGQPGRNTLDPIAEIARTTANATKPSVSNAAASEVAARDTVVADGAMPSATPMPGVVATGIPTRIATGQPASEIAAAPTIEYPPAAVVRPAMRPGMRPLLVAIDAGHGGQDPGAQGLNGSREKDVTLAIARELARQVNA